MSFAWGGRLSILLAAIGCGAAPPPREPAVERVVEPVAEAAEAPEPIERTWLRMPMVIRFPTNGTELDHDGREILNALSFTGERPVYAIRVIGHTSYQERAQPELELARAETVRQALVELGVEIPMEVAARGYTDAEYDAEAEECRTSVCCWPHRIVTFDLLVAAAR